MFYRFARALLRILCLLLFHMEFIGTENLPKGKGYIVASNHRSNFDPIFVGIGIRPTLTFMAKIELFQKPVVGAIMHAVGAFPVERGKGDTGAVDFAEKTVREGRVLAMFPEGTRSTDGKLGRLKSGCSVIAGATGADIVPVAVRFGDKLHFRCRVQVIYGAPITSAQLGVDSSHPSTIKAANRLLAQRISDMLGQEEAR